MGWQDHIKWHDGRRQATGPGRETAPPPSEPVPGPEFEPVPESTPTTATARVGIMEATIEAGPDGVLGTDDDVVTIARAVEPEPAVPAEPPAPVEWEHGPETLVTDGPSGPLAPELPPTEPPRRRRESTAADPATVPKDKPKRKRGRPRKDSK